MNEGVNELMNERNIVMKKIMMILMVAALALPTMAQTFGNQEQPNVQFQSTSTLQGSGSAYSATPVLNADGTAYNPAAAAQSPAQAPSGPNRVAPKDGSDNEYPLGDAVLPLMLMALAFGGVIYLRRRKARA